MRFIYCATEDTTLISSGPPRPELRSAAVRTRRMRGTHTHKGNPAWPGFGPIAYYCIPITKLSISHATQVSMHVSCYVLVKKQGIVG